MSTRILRFLGIVFAAALLVAACGDDDTTTADTGGALTEDGESTRDDDGDAPDDGDVDGEAAGEAGAEPVQESETSLGTVLVDAEGLTLYGFTPDEGGTPTCTDACAETWPPLFTDSSDLPESLDPSVFSVVEHPSGEPQLAAGGWPLYYYAADAEPGDVNGQGVGDKWFAVTPDGSLLQERDGTDGDTDDAETEPSRSDNPDY